MLGIFFEILTLESLKAGRMAMHACQIGPTDTAPLARNRFLGPASGQGGTLWHRPPFCPISPLRTYWYNYTLELGSVAVILSDIVIDQPWSSSSSISKLLVANTARGLTRSSIGCCVAASFGRSCPNSILWCIVKATKAATRSHPVMSLAWLKLSCPV